MTQTREMRRKEKEITNAEEIKDMLETCAVCRLGFSEGGVPYVIPINYGYTYAESVITVFFTDENNLEIFCIVWYNVNMYESI